MVVNTVGSLEQNKQPGVLIRASQVLQGAMGDIGTHAENLAEYITGLKISSLCADISTLVEGRKLDDDGSVLLRFENGARGILHASQICAGEENNLAIRVYGDRGGFEWRQMEPNTQVYGKVH